MTGHGRSKAVARKMWASARGVRGKRFMADRRGATAIEFSILALPFFALLFAVLETTISFSAEQTMANAADRLSREIRIGTLDPAVTDEDAFRAMICERMDLFVTDGCPGLHFDLQSYPNFAAVPKTIPYSAPGVIDTRGFRYAPGGAGTINNLRVLYKWPVITNLMKTRIAGLEDGHVLLYATTTWQNEPF